MILLQQQSMGPIVRLLFKNITSIVIILSIVQLNSPTIIVRNVEAFSTIRPTRTIIGGTVPNQKQQYQQQHKISSSTFLLLQPYNQQRRLRPFTAVLPSSSSSSSSTILYSVSSTTSTSTSSPSSASTTTTNSTNENSEIPLSEPRKNEMNPKNDDDNNNDNSCVEEQLHTIDNEAIKIETNETRTENNEKDNNNNSPNKNSMTNDRTSYVVYEMPWTEQQQRILNDNIPRYTITVRSGSSTKSTEQYILWRNLCYDIPELNGYPIQFLQQRYRNGTDRTSLISTKIPYYLDQYQFEPNGGLSGLIYGVSGIAAGTRITTSALWNVQQTLPQRYVQTTSIDDDENSDDGSSIIVYELGKPLTDPITVASAVDVYSLNGISKSTIVSQAKSLVNNLDPSSVVPKVDNDDGKDLLYLGGLTALLLTGAYATNILSHHLTINVFWV